MFFLLLRTFAWTAIILGCGIYYLNESLLPAPEKTAVSTAVRARRTVRQLPLKAPPPAQAAAEMEITDPLSLIKTSKAGPAATRIRAASAAVPRLKAVTFGGSGGSFVPLRQEGQEEEQASRAASAPRDPEAVLLPASAITRSVSLKGARPVPVATGKKYSGVDPEAEFLRERMRRQAAAAEAYRIRLRNEKLILAGWLTLLALAVTLVSSRVIKAWRAIHKPEGTHWTLK